MVEGNQAGSLEVAQHYSTTKPHNFSRQKPTGLIFVLRQGSFMVQALNQDPESLQQIPQIIWDMEFTLLVFSHLSLK